MKVLFTIDSDLTELVDAIGLDYQVNNNTDDITIQLDNIEELVEDEDDYNRLSDDELCEFLLSPTLCEGLIYTERLYDSDKTINEEIQFESIVKSKML